MIGPAFKEHVEPVLAHDRFHNAERQVETFEYRPLLDVKLQVSEGVVTRARFPGKRIYVLGTRWATVQCSKLFHNFLRHRRE